MRPCLLQHTHKVRVGSDVQLWKSQRAEKQKVFGGRLCCNVKYGAMHIVGAEYSHYMIFSYYP